MTGQDQEQEKWGGDELDPDDLQIPEIKLIQATGGSLAKGEGAEAGDFHASLTGEVFKGKEGFDMVVVRMAKQRTYWGRPEISDEPPQCASLQVTPMGGQSIFGDDCAVCSHRIDAPGAVSSEERRKGCTIGYNILAIINEIPMILRPSGISAGAAKELYTQLTLNRQIAGQWFRAKTHVTSVPKTTPSGEAFGLRFGKLELITDEKELEFNADFAKQLLGTQIAQIPKEASPDEPVTPEPEQIPEKIPAPHPVGCQCEVCTTATEKTTAATEAPATEKTEKAA
ncbi:hypothetical protein LCGC14_2073920, partial [marine sediment metagenome]